MAKEDEAKRPSAVERAGAKTPPHMTDRDTAAQVYTVLRNIGAEETRVQLEQAAEGKSDSDKTQTNPNVSYKQMLDELSAKRDRVEREFEPVMDTVADIAAQQG